MAIFSRLHCLAIPSRDFENIENQNKHRKMNRKPRSHIYRTFNRAWAIGHRQLVIGHLGISNSLQ